MFQNKDCLEMVEEIREKYSEYLEMMENPDSFVIGVMAHKIMKLENHIDYLERRLKS